MNMLDWLQVRKSLAGRAADIAAQIANLRDVHRMPIRDPEMGVLTKRGALVLELQEIPVIRGRLYETVNRKLGVK